MENYLWAKIVGVLLIANAVYASFAHRKGRLTIYVDWTDAAMTGLTPVIGLACFFALVFFQVPDDVARTISVLTALCLVGFGIRLSWRANGSLTAFLSATAARYTVLFSFYLLLWAVLSSRDRRRKYERSATVAKRNVAAIAALAAGYVSWSKWVSRLAEFTPISLWFSGKSVQLVHQEHTESQDESDGEPEEASETDDTAMPGRVTEPLAVEQRFHVVFKGLQSNAPAPEAKSKLATLFKGSLEQIDHLLTMPSHVLKRDLTLEIASKYKAAIETAGGVCELTPAGVPNLSLDADLPHSNGPTDEAQRNGNNASSMGAATAPGSSAKKSSPVGKWAEIFRLIEKAGGPKLRGIKDLPFGERQTVVFNVWAFLFGPFYYLSKGMWRKAVTLFALALVVIAILEVILGAIGISSNLASMLVTPVLFGTRANIDYYKKMVIGENNWW